MKKTLIAVMVVCLGLGVLSSAGCAKNAGSSSEAIQSSQSLKTVQEQASYLVNQAQAFYNSNQFQQAVETAQYVLSNLDSNSQPAQALIEKAKAKIQEMAQKAATEATNKLFGK